MDELLDAYGGTPLKDRLVLINDGAVWIHNWCLDRYPTAIHVLDYYHACEHLYEFAEQAFKDTPQRMDWAQEQKNNLLRMDYARYRTIGCGIIGSGAIESAHRTIIQKRLKQSGQRWGNSGAQNVLNLRAINASGMWNKVIQNIKIAAKNANTINLAA